MYVGHNFFAVWYLPSKLDLKIFVTADVVSLMVQAAGGGIASGTNVEAGKLGSKIMLTGIFLQMCTSE